jgi:hypothetical protein
METLLAEGLFALVFGDIVGFRDREPAPLA